MTDDLNLSEFDSAWAETPVDRLVKLEDGKYVAKLCFPEISRSKKTDRPMFSFSLVTDLGTVKKFYMLDDPSRFKYLKNDLVLLGQSLGKLSDLPNVFDKITGKLVDIAVVTKGDNQNIYLNSIHQEEIPDNCPF